MKQVVDKSVKYALSLIVIACSVPLAWGGVYQHGTVVRMRMSDCLPMHHGFMVTFAEANPQASQAECPEYTLVSDKVVYVIVGRASEQLIPLADVIDFRIHKNELDVRIDDAQREGKFAIKEMILRSEWDLVQKHVAEQMTTSPRPSVQYNGAQPDQR